MLATRLRMSAYTPEPVPVYSAYLNNFGTSSVISGSKAMAGVLVSTNGNVYSFATEFGYSLEYAWLTGDGTSADYEAWLDVTSGNMDASSDDQETWIPCSSSPAWFSFRNPPAGSVTSTYDLRIRAASTHATLATCTITAYCTVT